MTQRGCDGARVRACAIVAITSFLFTACFSDRSGTEPEVLLGNCVVPVADLIGGGAFVPIRNYAFLVDTIRVRAGTTVTWFNCEAPPPDPHTVTADAGAFDSPFFGPGQTYSRRFETRGTFPYHCTPHPTMRAVVIVE
jgi:plastocyanin